MRRIPLQLVGREQIINDIPRFAGEETFSDGRRISIHLQAVSPVLEKSILIQEIQVNNLVPHQFSQMHGQMEVRIEITKERLRHRLQLQCVHMIGGDFHDFGAKHISRFRILLRITSVAHRLNQPKGRRLAQTAAPGDLRQADRLLLSGKDFQNIEYSRHTSDIFRHRAILRPAFPISDVLVKSSDGTLYPYYIFCQK